MDKEVLVVSSVPMMTMEQNVSLCTKQNVSSKYEDGCSTVEDVPRMCASQTVDNLILVVVKKDI